MSGEAVVCPLPTVRWVDEEDDDGTPGYRVVTCGEPLRRHDLVVTEGSIAPPGAFYDACTAEELVAEAVGDTWWEVKCDAGHVLLIGDPDHPAPLTTELLETALRMIVKPRSDTQQLLADLELVCGIARQWAGEYGFVFPDEATRVYEAAARLVGPA